VWAVAELPAVEVGDHRPLVRGMAFYRRYTEAILRRYVKLSMEAGRAPSLLGREMFRGRVTAYKVHSFEDVVIFVHDVERCLDKLDRGQQQMIQRIALQEYSQGETAAMLGVGLRSVLRRYARALDVMSELLLESRLLEPMQCCQGVGSEDISVTSCFD
jgi:hypothetical protein